jgi:glutathione S-transferase
MKLYFSPGACSLSPHVALREAGLPFDLVKVDLAAKKLPDGSDFRRINPKGYVPALELDDGELVTEGAIIVQYVADLRPEARLAPPIGTRERRELQQWLHFVATELHKGFGPLNAPEASDEFKRAWLNRLKTRVGVLARAIEGRPYLVGDGFTVADGYAWYALRGLRKRDAAAVDGTPALSDYFQRISSRASVQAALAAEGLPA